MTGGNLGSGKGGMVSVFSFHSLAPSLLNRGLGEEAGAMKILSTDPIGSALSGPSRSHN